jgi:hypothetical protein
VSKNGRLSTPLVRASIRGADTVPARSRGYDAGKRVNGRKRHFAVDTGGLLLAVVVTIAGIQDRDGACPPHPERRAVPGSGRTS